ncbi:MAG: sigma 54-interacting transcriptional regulator [Candidatus Rokubacteria bacterium]|nr:sigma 54-interacting transcriptional regulator [Candidatus Rokubacteria bacterium]
MTSIYLAHHTVSLDDLKAEWKRFSTTGEYDPAKVRAFVGESWQRARSLGLDPLGAGPVLRLSGDAFQKKLRENSLLIRVAKPLMESLYPVLEKSSYWVVLYSPDGYILYRIGRPEDIRMLEMLGVFLGTCKREDVAGTTGFSLVSRLKAPVQIRGPEHYFEGWHIAFGSYAPILDPSGELIGAIGICSSTPGHHEHTLGMVMAAAASASNEIELHKKAREVDFAAKELEAIINSINDGVIAVNLSGEILEINRAGLGLATRRMEGGHPVKVDDVMGAEPKLAGFLDSIMSDPAAVVERRVRFTLHGGRSFDGLVSAMPILERDGAVIGAVMLVKNIKRLEKLMGALKQLEARYTLEDILGTSPEIQSAKRVARFAARSSSGVLLEGESGTGKELFAHAIHAASDRRDRPFVAVNCAAIPRELCESTLFGYAPGAFTGARTAGQEGKFQLAHGGTLFLDEIAELSLELQPKLLRAISEGRIEKVGGKIPIDIDVRLIAATNRNLKEEVAKGRFREDLFFRVNVVRIQVPPLRDRKSDLRPLTEHFVAKIVAKLGKPVRAVDPTVYARFEAYPWPGNVRELENVLESAINVMEGDTLRVDHLPETVAMRRSSAAMPGEALSLRDLERRAIEEALVNCRGKKTLVAKSLGISRDTLYRKLKELSIETS